MTMVTMEVGIMKESERAPIPLEVELRGLLTRQQYDQATNELGAVALSQERDDRRTTFFMIPDKTLKVTARQDGSMAKIALKLGSITGAAYQKEIEIGFEPCAFDRYIELFLALGFDDIQCTEQRRTNFHLENGVDIALKWSKDLGYHFEADCTVVDPCDVPAARGRLETIVRKFGLAPMTEAEFAELCSRVDAEYRNAAKMAGIK